jgi:hypothetical protein
LDFDELAKKVALLFDKIYLTDDLETTFELLGHCWTEGRGETLRYLQCKKLIFEPGDLGYASNEAFMNSNMKGPAAQLHRALIRVGNPALGEWDDSINVGHPDMGDLAAQNGWHPRSDKGWDDPAIKAQKKKYESLLLQRNAAMFREAGADAAIVGRFYPQSGPSKYHHPVWRILFHEMPQLDTRAPWEDIFDFRQEERTQSLIRNLRRWTRKIVSEEWSESELEDEIRELIFQYEAHLRLSQIHGGAEVLEFLVTGAAELAEDAIKLRFAKIAKIATSTINRSVKRLQEELHVPGRELALIPEMRQRF